MARATGLAILLTLAVVGSAWAEEPERIVGGRLANWAEFPHQVSLQLNGAHFCGGTIISEKHILTAAHCVHDIWDPNTLTVLTGTNNLRTGGELHRVAKIDFHERYVHQRELSWPNDVAVVTLTKPMVFNNLQKSIPLATTRPPVGASLAVSGFGYTKAEGQTSPDLKATGTFVLSHTDCQNRYALQKIYQLSQICGLLSVGHGACSGDSGGPVVYNNQVVGIVSWVLPCGIGFPDVFTSVAHYYDWIVQHMN